MSDGLPPPTPVTPATPATPVIPPQPAPPPGPFKRGFASARVFFGRVPGWAKALSGFIATLLLLNTQLTGLSGVVTTLVTNFHQSRHPGSYVVFVSNDGQLAKSYLNYLASSGAQTDTLDPNNVESLPRMNPDMVIFGSGAREPEPLHLSPGLISYLSGDVKVLGMGSLGGLVLQQIQPYSPLAFRHSVGIETSNVWLASDADKRFAAGLPIDAAFKLYEESAQTITPGLAVFDEGSLPLLGARGIADLGDTGGCSGRTWPVARQGNDLFWGYALPGTALTPEGRHLFVNLVMGVLRDDFQKPIQQQHYKDPGTYKDTLGCLFSTNEYRLTVSGVGALVVAVKSTKDLFLTVSGPGPADSYSAHGISPRIEVPISRESLNAGHDWLITTSYSGPMDSRTRIEYDLDLQYPSELTSVPQALVAVMALLLTLAVGGFSLVYLVRRHAFGMIRAVAAGTWAMLHRRRGRPT